MSEYSSDIQRVALLILLIQKNFSDAEIDLLTDGLVKMRGVR